jgi:hypothetical protein
MINLASFTLNLNLKMLLREGSLTSKAEEGDGPFLLSDLPKVIPKVNLKYVGTLVEFQSFYLL